jgi:hypothetical protein
MASLPPSAASAAVFGPQPKKKQQLHRKPVFQVLLQ